MSHNLKFLHFVPLARNLGANRTRLKASLITLKEFNDIRRCFSSSNNKCWNCGASNNGTIQIQCKKCQSLLELPNNVNHFDLLNIGQCFSINTSQLTQNFREMQTVIHPDKFSNKSEREQQLSADWSSLVNKAYKILLSPIQRAEYLLNLHGVTISEDNSAVNKEFLLYIMDRNEEVENAETEEDLKELLEKVKDDSKRCVNDLETSLHANDLAKAREQVITLRYFFSLENSIKMKGQSIGIVL